MSADNGVIGDLNRRAVALASAGATEAEIVATLAASINFNGWTVQRERVARLADAAHRTATPHEAAPRAALEPLDLSKLDQAAEPIPWLVENWCAKGDAIVLGGHAGAGKSVLIADLVLAVATGGAWLDQFSIGGPSWVGVFDAEQSERLILHRLQRQIRGRGLDPSRAGTLPIDWFAGQLDLSDAGDLDRLLERAHERRYGLIVFDSLTRFTGRLNQRDETDMSVFFSRVAPLTAELGATVIWLHHRRKPAPGQDDQGDQHSLRGSSDLPAAVSQLWLLDKNLTGVRTLYAAKNRWAPEAAPLGIEFEGDAGDDFLQVRATGSVADAESLILNLLTDSGTTGALRQAIVAAIEDAGSRDAARLVTKQLGRLHARQRVARRTEGKAARYWLTTFAPAEVLSAEGVLRGES